MKLNEILDSDLLTELSNELLGRYKTAAGKAASSADAAGDVKTGNKRFKGIVSATKKQFSNDSRGQVKEDSESGFADELYNAFEERYPLLCAKAGIHIIGNAIMDFMHYEGQVDPENLVQDLARAVKSSLTSVEF